MTEKPKKKEILESDKYSSNPEICFGKSYYNQAISQYDEWIVKELENIIDNGSSGAEMECCIEVIIEKIKGEE